MEFGGSRQGLFSLIYSYFPGLLSILYSKCKLDTLERSTLLLPGVPDCWWTWGCMNCKDLWLCNVLLLLLVSLRQGKCFTTTRTNPGQNHIGAQRNTKHFNKVLGKGKEHTMVLHSGHVRESTKDFNESIFLNEHAFKINPLSKLHRPGKMHSMPWLKWTLVPA